MRLISVQCNLEKQTAQMSKEIKKLQDLTEIDLRNSCLKEMIKGKFIKYARKNIEIFDPLSLCTSKRKRK